MRRLGAAQIAGLLLCTAGIAISVYLTSVHYADAPLVCSTTGVVSCEQVLRSSYAEVLGIPVSLFGLAWFLVMAAVLVFRPVSTLALAWAGIGVLTVFYLVFVELFRLEKICLWCTAAHALVLILAGLVLALAAREPARA